MCTFYTHVSRYTCTLGIYIKLFGSPPLNLQILYQGETTDRNFAFLPVSTKTNKLMFMESEENWFEDQLEHVSIEKVETPAEHELNTVPFTSDSFKLSAREVECVPRLSTCHTYWGSLLIVIGGWAAVSKLCSWTRSVSKREAPLWWP